MGLCSLKWHLTAGSSCGLWCENTKALLQPLVHGIQCYIGRKQELHVLSATQDLFQLSTHASPGGGNPSLWRLSVGSAQPYLQSVWVVADFWVLGVLKTQTSPTPNIIFTFVTQPRLLLLPCLTFWCGTNSQRPTGSPSSAKAVCIYLLSSLPLMSSLSFLLLLWLV